MSQALIEMLDRAIQETNEWVSKGWSMRFGPYQTEVASLGAANAMPKNFQNRQEALSYWNQVEMASQEALVWAWKARAALQGSDLGVAHNTAYAAKYIERRFRESTPTWGPVCEAIAKAS
jgi:hypothetical protein